MPAQNPKPQTSRPVQFLLNLARSFRQSVWQPLSHAMLMSDKNIRYAILHGAKAAEAYKDQPVMQILVCSCGHPECRDIILAIHNASITETESGKLVPYARIGPTDAMRLNRDLCNHLAPRD